MEKGFGFSIEFSPDKGFGGGGKTEDEKRDEHFSELMGAEVTRMRRSFRVRAVALRRDLTVDEKTELLEEVGYVERFVEALEKEGIDINTPEGMDKADEITRWCLQISPEEEKKKETREFTDEEEMKIIQFCLDQVFIGGESDLSKIKKSLLGGEGFIAVNLRGGREVPLDPDILRKIESLGVDKWADIRGTVGRWANFKEMDEIKSSTLTSDLFLDTSTEKFLARSKVFIPWKDERTGRVELREVDLGDEIGSAMKKMREYFEGSLNDQGERVPEGSEKPREYWWMIGADLGQKEQLYTKLGLNRYIGEAAFSLLLSYQMLTDTSADDYMSMMVQQARSRPNKYKVSEDRDPFVRMLVQEDLTRGVQPFTNLSGEQAKVSKKKMEERLAMMFPSQLIPTGLSFDGGRGEIELRRGNWLKWRDDSLFTRAQLDAAPEGQKEPATDQDTRLAMMRSALNVLLLIKEIQDPNSDVEKLASLTGKLYSHAKSSMGDAYWLIKDGESLLVPADMSPRKPNGEKAPMELREWVSRFMLTASEMFLFTHSIADSKNDKPFDMELFAETAEKLFRFESQSGKPSFVGMSEMAIAQHRKELLSFVDRLWKNCWEVVNTINGQKSPSRYPKWYSSGVSARRSAIDAARSSLGWAYKWREKKRLLQLK